MFDTKKFRLPDKVTYKKDLCQKSQFWSKMKEFMGDEDAVCEEILVNGYKYKKGDLVANEVLECGEALKVGVIKMILLRGSEVFFVITQFVAKKDTLGFYESTHVETEYLFSKSSHWLMISL